MSYTEAIRLIVELVRQGHPDAAESLAMQAIIDGQCFCAALYLFWDMDVDTAYGFAYTFADVFKTDIRKARTYCDTELQ